jgi:glutamate---cysteine ligase / carboxylate-amine ligase
MLRAQEVLDENRFLAARDGVEAAFVDPDRETSVPVRDLIDPLLEACAPHAEALGCTAELAMVPQLVEEPGAERQRRLAGEDDDQRRLVAALADDFTPYPAHVA